MHYSLISQLSVKLFIKIRRLIFNHELLEKYLPKTGCILDVGCGHGTWANYLANKSPKRKVIAIDPDLHKIQLAKKLYSAPNLKFQRKNLDFSNDKFDAITICDVLYLLPDHKLIKLLKYCNVLLKPKGVLLIKETKPNLFIKLEEWIMKSTHLTYSKSNHFYFRGFNKYQSLLNKQGFQVLKRLSFQQILVYKHFVLIAQKQTY